MFTCSQQCHKTKTLYLYENVLSQNLSNFLLYFRQSRDQKNNDDELDVSYFWSSILYSSRHAHCFAFLLFMYKMNMRCFMHCDPRPALFKMCRNEMCSLVRYESRCAKCAVETLHVGEGLQLNPQPATFSVPSSQE